jgi:hypothetical protein
MTTAEKDPYEVDFSAFTATLRAIPVKRILLAIAISLATIFVGDFLSIRFKIPERDQFSTVKVQSIYAIPQKSQTGDKLSYQPGDSSDVQCANSLFPQLGANPCWYVNEHKSVRIDE